MGVKRSHDHAMTGSGSIGDGGGDAGGPTATPSTRAAFKVPSGDHRQRQQQQDANDAGGSSSNAPSSPFMPMFERFRDELDEHHDRRERIIKASRDVTAASKKIIFTLQRIRVLNQPLPANIIKSNAQYHGAITTSLASVVPDLQTLSSDRYARQISGGAQEWMEAASFQHYLTTATLLSYPDAVQQMRDLTPPSTSPDSTAAAASTESIHLSYEDYLLGIYDMTGELMRFAITAMATSGALPEISGASASLGEGGAMEGVSSSNETGSAGNAVRVTQAGGQRTLLTDLRGLRAALESLDVSSLGGPFARDVEKKMEVMRQSVEKVERGLYGLIVRGAERPKGWMPDVSSSARDVEVEGYEIEWGAIGLRTRRIFH